MPSIKLVPVASFPGFHAQLLLLAVRKVGEGLDGFIMWCMPLLTSRAVASHDRSSSNRTRRTNWTERMIGIQGKKSEGECEQTELDVSSSTHHVINPSRPSPHFSYCKQQKLDVEAWERG